jgi:metal-responsive CopG/Arc/MetJ family transcriptional regulator
MVGRGAVRIGRKIQVRIPDDHLAILDEESMSRGINRAEMIRQLVAEFITEEWSTVAPRSK